MIIMTHLEEYYQNKPYPFFIVHMIAIVGFVALLITSLIMLVAHNSGTAVIVIHKLSSWLLMIGLVISGVEALVVKLFAPSAKRKPFGYRIPVLKEITTRQEVAIYTTYCVLSWALLPIVFIFAFLSGIGAVGISSPVLPFHTMDPGLLARFHHISGALFVIMIILHVALSVPARRAREKANQAISSNN